MRCADLSKFEARSPYAILAGAHGSCSHGRRGMRHAARSRRRRRATPRRGTWGRAAACCIECPSPRRACASREGRRPPNSQVCVPKERRTYCKGGKCRRHTVHKVSQYKAGKASNFAQGACARRPTGAPRTAPLRARARQPALRARSRAPAAQAGAVMTASSRATAVRPSLCSTRRPRRPRRSPSALSARSASRRSRSPSSAASTSSSASAGRRSKLDPRPAPLLRASPPCVDLAPTPATPLRSCGVAPPYAAVVGSQ